ncbi:allophanate hydrolase [Roseobacter sp.]|uniref:allophanate hydrolase n=1 Tax=Roseobacter sp. TaxID=1907202 RepID=UPI003858869A
MLKTLPFTLAALRNAYAEGVRPEDVIEEVHARLDRIGDQNIFIHLCDKADLLEQARRLGAHDPDLPLWGIPFAVKDNIDVAGIETTAACPAYAYMPEQDAFVVGKLRAAGALVIGKTNLDQFATGLVGVRSPYGVPLNSIDPAIAPGGSSAGSGVIVGHGAVTFSLGTDTAGSGRVPAALNNIVGLKPTLGTLSASGVVPACRTLDTVSIFAHTVDDAYAVYSVAQGYDEKDAYSRAIAHGLMSAPPKSLRIGVPDKASVQFYGDTTQEAAFSRDVARLVASGAEIVEVDFTPLYAIAAMLYQGAWVAERHTVIAELLDKDPEAVHPVTRQIVGLAETLSADDAFRGFYRLADLKREAAPMLAGLHMLCVPTIPDFVTVEELQADPIGPNNRMGTYTNFVNLMDMCGIAVPTAPRSDGRPGSVTLLAEAGQDALVASVARSFEQDCPRSMGASRFALPQPKPLPDPVPDRIDLAVCGAHMSGLPLNSEMTKLGAQFVRSDKTAPCYKFYALSGGPPVRPGLVRASGNGTGSVSIEIWSLPKTAMGQFIEGIPAPLAIGSVELADGTWVKSFVCEADGTTDARDITDLGDWRQFLAQQMERT